MPAHSVACGRGGSTSRGAAPGSARFEAFGRDDRTRVRAGADGAHVVEGLDTEAVQTSLGADVRCNGSHAAADGCGRRVPDIDRDAYRELAWCQERAQHLG